MNALKSWLEEGRSAAPTVEIEVAGQRLAVRRVRNLGWWQSVVRRAEAASKAGPFGVPEEARKWLPDDAESASDLIRSALILEALLAPPNEADAATLLELAAVNAPIYAALVEKVASVAASDGARLEAEAVDEAKKNSG